MVNVRTQIEMFLVILYAIYISYCDNYLQALIMYDIFEIIFKTFSISGIDTLYPYQIKQNLELIYF